MQGRLTLAAEKLTLTPQWRKRLFSAEKRRMAFRRTDASVLLTFRSWSFKTSRRLPVPTALCCPENWVGGVGPGGHGGAQCLQAVPVAPGPSPPVSLVTVSVWCTCLEQCYKAGRQEPTAPFPRTWAGLGSRFCRKMVTQKGPGSRGSEPSLRWGTEVACPAQPGCSVSAGEGGAGCSPLCWPRCRP